VAYDLSDGVGRVSSTYKPLPIELRL
jgi:hypothetical protein